MQFSEFVEFVFSLIYELEEMQFEIYLLPRVILMTYTLQRMHWNSASNCSFCIAHVNTNLSSSRLLTEKLIKIKTILSYLPPADNRRNKLKFQNYSSTFRACVNKQSCLFAEDWPIYRHHRSLCDCTSKSIAGSSANLYITIFGGNIL